MAQGKKADWDRWLTVFRNSANVRVACEAVGVTRDAAYGRRRTHPTFRAAWDAAEQDAVDTLEAAAWKRARDTSDKLLMFLLQAHRPEKYAARIVVIQKAASELKDMPEGDLLQVMGYDGVPEPVSGD